MSFQDVTPEPPPYEADDENKTGTEMTVLDVQTGELLDLETATREQIAGWYLHVLEVHSVLQQAIRLAEKAFADKSDRETTLTVTVDGWKVSVPGAADRFVADEETLRAALLGLVADGELSQQAADEACAPRGVDCPSCGEFVPTGGYKVSRRAVTALRKVKAHDAIIDATGEYVPPARSFTVKRA